MENKTFLNLIENKFGVHDGDNYIELETWTEGGVNMFVTIDKESNKTYLQQFKEYALNLDIDEQIEVHRQDKNYRNDFTIRESVEDFEEFEVHLKAILSDLERSSKK